MINITVDALKDYCICPQLYVNKHLENVIPERAKTTAGFDGHSHIVINAQNVVDNMVSFYFHRLMDNRQVRYSTLYNKWEEEWWDGYTGKDIMEYIVPVSRANKVRINTNLINHLPKFYNTFHKPFKPLVVNKEISFPSGNISVNSKIQMAYRSNTDTIRIVKFIPNRIATGSPDKDIHMLTQACSWMKFYDEKKVEIAYYCMMSPDDYNPFTISKITADKIDSLDRIILAFENKETINDIICKGCEYNCKEVLNEALLQRRTTGWEHN